MVSYGAMPSGVPTSQTPLVRAAILALLLIVLGALRFSSGAGNGPYGHDGGNYFNIARNVAEGRGLVTSLSLYHIGYKNLPAPSFQTYPLWPLLLGYTGRAIGMYEAADLLPRVLYLLSLLLLYFAAKAIARGVELSRFFDYGHLAVLLFGLNPMYFMSTTFPYTEGLAFAILFAAIALLARPAPLHAALAGVLAGLGFLTRTQMLIFVIAAVMGFIATRLWRALALFLLPAVAAWAYWYFTIYTVPQDTTGISSFKMWVQPPSRVAWLQDRLTGAAISFDPTSSMSLFHLFGAAAILPVFALAVFIVRRRFGLPSPEHLPLLVALLTGLGTWASLLLYRQTFFLEWLFGYRHGLPYILLILAALAYLGTARRTRIVALVLAALSIGWGAIQVVDFATAPRPTGPPPAEAALVRWLADQPKTPTVLTTNAQTLTVWSRAHFHWTLCTTPPEKTREMLATLPIDYVVLYDHERPCPFVRGLNDVLVGEVRFAEGPGAIWLLKRRP